MKAQFWSFDVIFAMIIFGSALLILTFVWTSVSNQYSSSFGLGVQTMQAQLQSLQARILSAGTPSNWNSVINITNTSTYANISVGLGSGTGSQLSLGKILSLMAMTSYSTATYQATKPMLGVGYDYYITINSGNSTMTMGLNPYTTTPYAIQSGRSTGYLNGAPARIQIMVWTNKTFGVT